MSVHHGVRRIRRRLTPAGQCGNAAIELVLLTPLLMVCILVVVQFALWQHARHVLLSAAQEGARVARAQGGTAEDGRARAHDYIRQIGPDLVSSPDIDIDRGLDTVVVRIRGQAANIVPGLPLHVTATSAGPVERFRAP
jgi:Flp pilus assembly protein TadG